MPELLPTSGASDNLGGDDDDKDASVSIVSFANRGSVCLIRLMKMDF